MAELKGFVPPLTPEGRSSVVPGPPWHYSGDLLTIEYRAAPGSVARWLPDPLEPAEEDPDAVAVIFADWQSCSDTFQELLDPVRSQYKEAFVVVRCRYRGETYSRCILIWVDKDFAMVRGWHQGYPKKLGSIWITRPVTARQGGPPARTRRAVRRVGRRERPTHHRRSFHDHGKGRDERVRQRAPDAPHRATSRSIEEGEPPSMNELVTMKSYDWEGSEVWTGDAEIAFGSSPTEELESLAPVEPIAGYWRSVGVTWGIGTRLA